MSEQVSNAEWVLAYVFLSLSLYACVAAAVWPYARPILPVWWIFLAFLFPPGLFFLSIYILIFSLYIPPIVPIVDGSGKEEFVARRV